jgi:multimeric flavodoxin WrbA
MSFTEKQRKLRESGKWDFQDLTALFLNCTLKPTPVMSHTEGLINVSRAIMEKNGVSVEVLRPVDFNMAPGVYPDMTEHGFDKDDWLSIYEKVKAANILVI